MTKAKKITYDKDLGIKEVSSKKGFYKIKLDLKQKHLNHGGIAHGGVLAGLLDIALAGAVSTTMEKDEWCLTASLSIEYLNPAFPGEIYAFGKLVKRGKNLAFVEGGIQSKDKKLLTKATGIWIIKTLPIHSTKIKPSKKMD
jgi:uncharacterized protein (TIGR00369 family)